ncbi:hypothetical protein ACHAPU_000988 [Fusarium lateritium]
MSDRPNKRYFSSDSTNSRGGGFGRGRGAPRAYSRSFSGPPGQQQQQQQQAAPAAKKPIPGTREEADVALAYWTEQATSHFNNKTKYEKLYKEAISKMATWKDIQEERPVVPVSATTVVADMERERAARQKEEVVVDKEKEKDKEDEE